MKNYFISDLARLELLSDFETFVVGNILLNGRMHLLLDTTKVLTSTHRYKRRIFIDESRFFYMHTKGSDAFVPFQRLIVTELSKN